MIAVLYSAHYGRAIHLAVEPGPCSVHCMQGGCLMRGAAAEGLCNSSSWACWLWLVLRA